MWLASDAANRMAEVELYFDRFQLWHLGGCVAVKCPRISRKKCFLEAYSTMYSCLFYSAKNVSFRIPWIIDVETKSAKWSIRFHSVHWCITLRDTWTSRWRPWNRKENFLTLHYTDVTKLRKVNCLFAWMPSATMRLVAWHHNFKFGGLKPDIGLSSPYNSHRNNIAKANFVCNDDQFNKTTSGG